jgi:hypothetical protein
VTGAEKRERNLIPWKPGQSGNPDGHSRKRRAQKRLRQALDAMLEQEIPPEMLEQIDERVRAALPDGITFAEIIALRVTWTAATAREPGQILQAASLILGAQAKPDQFSQPFKPEPPRLAPSDERRQAVADQLGVKLEE